MLCVFVLLLLLLSVVVFVLLYEFVSCFFIVLSASRVLPQTRCADNIRGCSAKDPVLAQLSHYWNVVSDQSTPPEIAGDRFRIGEVITSRTYKEQY